MNPFYPRQVIDLPEVPILRPAKIVGSNIKLYGSYPVLVRELPDVRNNVSIELHVTFSHENTRNGCRFTKHIVIAQGVPRRGSR